jgi:hypothetical protein
MNRSLGAVVVLVFSLNCGLGSVRPVFAADEDAAAILDKAIKAAGGEEKLSKVEAFQSKGKGKITFGDNTNDFKSQTTVQGLDRYRLDVKNENDEVTFQVVVSGEKGWRKFGENTNEMSADDLSNEKRSIYLSVAPVLPVIMKGKGFKIARAGEEKVGDKPAANLKVTAPDGKDFTISFDKETGLAVKVVATVTGFMGQEISSERTYSAFKDLGGIKRASKVEIKFDGRPFLEEEVTDFQILEKDKVGADTFAEPK